MSVLTAREIAADLARAASQLEREGRRKLREAAAARAAAQQLDPSRRPPQKRAGQPR